MCTIVYIILCIYIYINCIFLNSKFHDRYCFTQHVTDILSWEFMQVPSKSPIHHWVTPFLSINMTVIYIIKKWWNDMKWCQGQRISLYVHDFPDENFHEMLFFCGSSQVSKRKQVVNHGDFPPEILHSRNHQLRQHQTGLLKQGNDENSHGRHFKEWVTHDNTI